MSNRNKASVSEPKKPAAAKQSKAEKARQSAPSPEKEHAMDTQSEFSRIELLRTKR